MYKIIEIPTNCPSCGSNLVIINMQLFCKNICCTAVVSKQIEHFCKVMGIKGVGEKTIAKLNFASIVEIYTCSKQDLIDRLGSEKLGSKLFDEIEKSKHAELETIIASFGIPLVGNTISKKIVSVIQSIDDINEQKCNEAKLGQKATANLLNFLNTDFMEIREYLPLSFSNSVVKVSHSSNNETICLTGKLSSFKTKALATVSLQELGFTVTETVTKATNYLVDEENKNSTKRQKADSLGIKIIPNLLNFIDEKN